MPMAVTMAVPVSAHVEQDRREIPLQHLDKRDPMAGDTVTIGYRALGELLTLAHGNVVLPSFYKEVVEPRTSTGLVAAAYGARAVNPGESGVAAGGDRAGFGDRSDARLGVLRVWWSRRASWSPGT